MGVAMLAVTQVGLMGQKVESTFNQASDSEEILRNTSLLLRNPLHCGCNLAPQAPLVPRSFVTGAEGTSEFELDGMQLYSRNCAPGMSVYQKTPSAPPNGPWIKRIRLKDFKKIKNHLYLAKLNLQAEKKSSSGNLMNQLDRSFPILIHTRDDGPNQVLMGCHDPSQPTLLASDGGTPGPGPSPSPGASPGVPTGDADAAGTASAAAFAAGKIAELSDSSGMKVVGQRKLLLYASDCKGNSEKKMCSEPYTKAITFPTPFSAPPHLVVTLEQAVYEDNSTKGNTDRVYTYAENVTATGFTLRAGGSPLNSISYYAGYHQYYAPIKVTWMAFGK